MRNELTEPNPERGFSLVELLMVVAIIVILAAVALPNIGGYIRNYKIKGATQQVAGEIQQARMKAITQNVNTGITFAVVDPTHYRWVSDDAQARGDNPYLGALYDLPSGVRFDVAGVGPAPSLRFNRLGTACVPGTGNCGPAFTPNFWAATEASRVATGSAAPTTSYISLPAGTSVWLVTLREQITGLTRTVRIEPGGRISSQQ